MATFDRAGTLLDESAEEALASGLRTVRQAQETTIMPRWMLLNGAVAIVMASILSLRTMAQPAAAGAGAAASTRPNFLFLITDDQRWDELGCVQQELGERGRFPWFKTPNMDRLAAEGVRFRNAFVVNSLCSPSPAAVPTGQCNLVHGVANNHTPFPTDNVTFATLLRAAGYTTGYIGKWHMDQQKGQRPGF